MSPAYKLIPSDQKQISVLSSLTIGELKVVDNEARLIGRKRVNKLLPSLLSGCLSTQNLSGNQTSLSKTMVSTSLTLSILSMMYLQYLRSLSLSYKTEISSVQVIPDYDIKQQDRESHHVYRLQVFQKMKIENAQDELFSYITGHL